MASKSSHLSSLDSKSWLSDLLVDPEWKRILAPCFSTPNFKKMEIWLQKEYEENDVLPPTSLIFNVFNLTRYNEVSQVDIT